MKTAAIIQARMSSRRLPGKVLLPLGGKTVLARVVQRVRVARRLDEVWVATSGAAADDVVVDECRNLSVPVFRGSLDDVLSRYDGAARASGAEVIVRVTSDCPLFDGRLLDEMLLDFADGSADYLSNTLQRTFPRGLDAEIFTRAALERACRQAALPYEREHVTPYIYRHPELFRLQSHTGTVDLSVHRWTLDTPEDYQLLRAIFEQFALEGDGFSTAAVLNFLKGRPELAKLNAHIEQKKAG